MRLAGRQESRHIRPCRPRKVGLYFISQELFIVSVPRTSRAACWSLWTTPYKMFLNDNETKTETNHWGLERS